MNIKYQYVRKPGQSFQDGLKDFYLQIEKDLLLRGYNINHVKVELKPKKGKKND